MKKSSLKLRQCIDEICRNSYSHLVGRPSSAVETVVRAGAAGLEAVLAGPTTYPDGTDPRDVFDGLQTLVWLMARLDPQPILDELERSPQRNFMLVAALGNAKGKASANALINAMSDKDPFVREAAARALISRKVIAAKPALIKSILDRSSTVVFIVVDAINKLDVFRDPAALPNLRRLLTQKRVKKHSPGTWKRAQEAVTRLERESQNQPVLEATYSWSDIKNRDIARIVRQLPFLQSLDLSETGIGNAGLQHLLALRDLQRLDLQNTKVTWKGIELIAASPIRLKSLSLGGISINGPHLQILSNMLSLEELDLGGVKTTDDQLIHLAPLRSLNSLRLSFWCGDNGLKALRTLTKLETLELYDTQVTDAGLSVLKSMKRLKSLRIDHCSSITDAGIASLGACKKLVRLRVVGTNISPAGVARLRELLPNCQIES